MSRIAPRPRVSASLGAALGALVLACAAPSAIAAEPPPPPPPAGTTSQGLNLQLGELLQVSVVPNNAPGQTNLPIGLYVNVPSVLDLKVETGVGLTTPPGPGANLGAQVPLAVDLTTPVGAVNLDANVGVDASLLNGENVVDAAATVDVNAEASLLGLETELGANVAANVGVGKNTNLQLAGDLRLPPDLERIIDPAGSPSAPKPLPVGSGTATPPVVEQPPAPPVDPTPPAPVPPAPPVDGPEPTPPPIDPTPPKPPVAVPPPVAEVPVVEVPPQPSAPLGERLRDVAVAAGRSIWLPLGLMIALFAYLLGQRLLDGGAKLASAGRSATPDDEIIEL